MAIVGELLKKARLEKKIEISDVERETKIKSAFIKALEEGQYSKLPSYTYARGFLTNYVQFLGLETEKVLALFRREYDAREEDKLLPTGLNKFPTKRIRVTLAALLLLILFLGFLFYFFFQYKGFLGSPNLQLSSPANNEIIKSESVTVAGKTDPDAQLIINNKVVLVLEDGSFEEIIPVFKGDFNITVASRNRFGKESKIIRTVKVENGP